MSAGAPRAAEGGADPVRARRAALRAVWLAVLLVALGAALRLGAATGDLWFDELWSLARAEQVERPLDVILKSELQHDNNHWLTTLWLHALGPGAAPLAHRALSWSTSLLALVLLGRLAWRRSPQAGLLTLALAAPSFLLVLYGSEARGYSGAILASLLTFALLERDESRRALWHLPAFWAAAVLGTASHLTFLYAYAALLAWHGVHVLRRPGRRAALLRLLAFHGPPLAVMGTLYLTTLRHLVIGGGPKYSTASVALETVGWLLGAPTGSPWAYAALSVVLLVVVAELRCRLRERDDTVLLFPAMVLVPALVLCVREPEVLYPRYFLVCVPYFLLWMGSLLARAWRGPPALRLGAVLLLAGTSAGNLAADVRLLQLGRGQYRAALRYLDEATPAGPLEIGVEGDHNLRLLRHHADALGLERELVLRDASQSAAKPPPWVLGSTQDQTYEPPRELKGAAGARYVLARAFGYAGLSGQRWFLYRRRD